MGEIILTPRSDGVWVHTNYYGFTGGLKQMTMEEMLTLARRLLEAAGERFKLDQANNRQS